MFSFFQPINYFTALKKSYVDVFNPSGAPMSKPSEPIMAPTMPQGPTPQTGFFVPGQTTNINGQNNVSLPLKLNMTLSEMILEFF